MTVRPSWPALLMAELAQRRAIVLRSKPASAEGPACPKCGYAGDDDWRKFLWVTADEARSFNLRDERGAALGECLMVACSRCNFRWQETVRNPDPHEAPS